MFLFLLPFCSETEKYINPLFIYKLLTSNETWLGETHIVSPITSIMAWWIKPKYRRYNFAG